MKNHHPKITMESPDSNPNKQTNIFGTTLRRSRKTGDVCSGGPSGVFRQNSDTEKSQRPGALSSCARAARQSIGGIGNLISRKMASADPPPQIPWPNHHHDYEVGEVIGVGATAVVHYAFCKPREEKCAIKKIYLEKGNTSMDELLKEIQAMSNCNHENVVTYYTSFVVDDELWLVLKLLEGGSLLDIIKQKMRSEGCRHGVFDEATIATVLKEVLKGLDYFHKNGQIHRDVKAGNILIGEDGDVQLADFGVSAWLAQGRDLSKPTIRHTFVGTPCWMAPEVMEQDHGYDFKADIWSFGITALEMASGTAPYHKYPPMKVLILTLRNDPPNLDTISENKDQYKAYGKSFRKLIVDCLQKDPKKRPTAAELLQHPFFKKAKDKKSLGQYFVATAAKGAAHRASKKPTPSTPILNSSPLDDWNWSDDDEEEFLASFKRTTINNNIPEMKPLQEATASIDEMKICENGHINSLASKLPETNPLSFVLRIRNKHRQLDDIRFDFVPGKDVPSGIASELECAGLVDPRDVQVIADNLSELITKPHTTNFNSVVFQLNSPSPHDTFNDKVLLGFAQLSLAD